MKLTFDLLFVFGLQSFPEYSLVFELEVITIDGVVDQVGAERLECHVHADHVEGVHQYVTVSKSFGRAKIFEFHAAG